MVRLTFEGNDSLSGISHVERDRLEAGRPVRPLPRPRQKGAGVGALTQGSGSRDGEVVCCVGAKNRGTGATSPQKSRGQVPMPLAARFLRLSPPHGAGARARRVAVTLGSGTVSLWGIPCPGPWQHVKC